MRLVFISIYLNIWQNTNIGIVNVKEYGKTYFLRAFVSVMFWFHVGGQLNMTVGIT